MFRTGRLVTKCFGVCITKLLCWMYFTMVISPWHFVVSHINDWAASHQAGGTVIDWLWWRKVVAALMTLAGWIIVKSSKDQWLSSPCLSISHKCHVSIRQRWHYWACGVHLQPCEGGVRRRCAHSDEIVGLAHTQGWGCHRETNGVSLIL